jgi:rhodanese-related sulfurtransferase
VKKFTITDIIFYAIMGVIALYMLYVKGYIFRDFQSITPQEALVVMRDEDDNVTIVDVRTVGEFQQGHIKNALNIPVQDLSERLDELKEYKDKKLLIYCATGNRSVIATRMLQSDGYSAINIEDGIEGLWEQKVQTTY